MKELSESRKKELETLKKLVQAAYDRYNEEDIVAVFNKVSGEKYGTKEDFTEDWVEKDDYDAMVSELELNEDYCIFKTSNMVQREKLREFAEKDIFPYSNEQQEGILF